MEPLSITIQPPITEHCTKCDYEAARSFHSTLCKCPKCGETSVYSGARRPKEKAIYVTKSQGSFNWANPSKKQYQYTFYNVSDKLYRFIVDEDLEEDDYYNLAIELKEIIDRYLINSDKGKIKELVDIIDNEEFQEKQEILKMKEEKERLERSLYKLYKRMKLYNILEEK